MGSVIDGEDVVQDTFARAFVALDELEESAPMRAWLFRIAHNRALDLLRSRAIRPAEPIEAAQEVADPEIPDPVEVLMRREAVETAVSRFAELPTMQRSVVILKDVLDQSLEEIAAMLDLTVNAVKAHLARGRARLKAINAEAPAKPRAAPAVTRRGPLCRVVQPARLGRVARDAGRRRAADPVDISAARRRRRRGHVLRHLFAQRPGAARPRLARWPRGDRGLRGSCRR
jgi:RNA polymerase sigma factor (sigma-70 family)